MQRSHILAVEASEGTEAMIARSLPLRRRKVGGVLVKVKKPQQDRRLDLPTIGPDTIDQAAASKLAGIAVEAGNAMIIQAEEVKRRADKHGLFVVATDTAELEEWAA